MFFLMSDAPLKQTLGSQIDGFITMMNTIQQL
jgi:hypothetical protein